MNRSLILLAALAMSTQAFAVGPAPRVTTSNLPSAEANKTNRNPNPVQAIPTLTSAKFVKSEVSPEELVDVKFDGINLEKYTNPHSNSFCNAFGHWPAEFHISPNLLIPVAFNGAWGLYSTYYSSLGTLMAPNLPGTYVVTFFAQGAGGWDGIVHPCTSNGPITATLVVKKPPLLPTVVQ